jgi:hypothetical protein
MKRRVGPELLDRLPPGEPAAIASRRDLMRINRVMGQAAWMARALARFPPPRLLLDLGGGDGRFLLGVARRLPWRSVQALIADRQDIVSAQTKADFRALGWDCSVRQGDALETIPALEPGALVTANLFLHHLQAPALAQLFAAAAGTAAGLVACEPRRNLFALAASHLVFALGANHITRHDAVASVRAGFAGRELSALWPPGWDLTEQPAPPFGHLFVARRHAL